MKKTYFSQRVYKHTLPTALVNELSHVLHIFNQAKRFAFQTLVREKRWSRNLHNESLQIVLKKNFRLNDYYANSARQEAIALFSAVKEQQTLHLQQIDEKIKDLKKKLKSERSYLTKMKKVKESFKKGKPTFPKNTFFAIQPSGIVSLSLPKKTMIWLTFYSFEHYYLDPKIKNTKAKVGRLKHRFDRLQQKKEKLQKYVPSAVFGTKKLFRSQFTKEEFVTHHEGWKTLFSAARNKQMMISGRKDARCGNFVFQYNIEKQELSFTSIHGNVWTFPFLMFPYGQDIVNHVIAAQIACKQKKKYGEPISWSIEDYGAYYLIKCMVDVESNSYINFSTSDGVIGVDCNYDHLAWGNVSKDGNYLESGSLSFSLEEKCSGAITKILEAEAIRLVELAVQKNKPIVLEKLDTTLSKTGNKYDSKKRNRMKSMFAYRKMIKAIQSRANQMGVEVKEINPAYTSISGKMKYMRKFGISIHQAAAFTIGRRGLGYQEKVPNVFKTYMDLTNMHHWKQWNIWNKQLAVRTHVLYTLFDVNRPHDGINESHMELTEEERKGMRKLLAYKG
ncbi:IS200/IS605 family accessory protein TnpB-related protein [Bacillus cereus group sp. BfR-BA-01380]|uniref:IS200/IS605 family accessory protein TnpB-related protein n=1 Tax=Bacillus cereus group sp. BfR-BA-01380 TaxID=2920324 RepID=UPI001F57D301|nr:IS200/IS605 family accessory protein TnpB-related protein [Bacillus cereus group sp. BfR-BA-01380]